MEDSSANVHRSNSEALLFVAAGSFGAEGFGFDDDDDDDDEEDAAGADAGAGAGVDDEAINWCAASAEESSSVASIVKL